MMPERKPYLSDLSDREWAILETLMPAASEDGVERKYEWHEILNGISYALPLGCAWLFLPRDLPDWQFV